MPRPLRCALLASTLLGACEAHPQAGPSTEVGLDRPEPEVLVHERDAALPPGFPLPLPDLAEVLDGQHLVTEAGLTTTSWSVSARTQTEDLDDVREALEGELHALGFAVETIQIPGGQGRNVTLAAHDPDCTVEVGALLHHDTRADHPPGVTLVVTWTELR